MVKVNRSSCAPDQELGSGPNRALVKHLRCPESLVQLARVGDRSDSLGYFRMGQDTICYGRCVGSRATQAATEAAYDALPDVVLDDGVPCLPFDPSEVADNLRRERYAADAGGLSKSDAKKRAMREAYYLVRPLLPVDVRRHFQKFYLRGWDKLFFPSWPVDRTVERIFEKLLTLSLRAQGLERIPFIWFWPEGYLSCSIMTHDVEQASGLEFCATLMDINDSVGIKSSFQIVPESRYVVSEKALAAIRDRGFEVNVHDLNHDGRLYEDREEFNRRAEKINRYAWKFGASGFRSGALYRNVEWYDAFEFSYDMSVPNVAHLDPQRGGCCTVMPYFVGKILELPLTTTQDYSLFQILGDYSINLWKRQIELILEKHGLISFIVHPDYVIEERAQRIYRELLGYISDLRAVGKVWIALPGEVDRWWRARSQMNLVNEGGKWTIQGAGSERARIAFATLDGDSVKYTIADTLESASHKSKAGQAI